MAVWVTDSTRSEDFVELLSDLVQNTPAGLDLHFIVATWRPRTPTSCTASWPTTPRAPVLHPAHASWLNQVLVYRPSKVGLRHVA